MCLPLNLSPHLGKSKTPIVTSITKTETESFHFGQAGNCFLNIGSRIILRIPYIGKAIYFLLSSYLVCLIINHRLASTVNLDFKGIAPNTGQLLKSENFGLNLFKECFSDL